MVSWPGQEQLSSLLCWVGLLVGGREDYPGDSLGHFVADDTRRAWMGPSPAPVRALYAQQPSLVVIAIPCLGPHASGPGKALPRALAFYGGESCVGT